MISLNGSCWTDASETHEVYEKLVGEYGTEIWEPSCQNEWRGKQCGKTTCYMIEEGSQSQTQRRIDGEKRTVYATRFKKPGVQLLCKIANIPFYFLDGKIYVAMLECTRCSAAKAGAELARTTNDNKAALTAITKKPLTAIEADEYRNVFLSAFANAKCKIEQQTQTEDSRKSRYEMRK